MFLKNIGCLILSIWLLNFSKALATKHVRIIGGDVANITEFPYLVEIWISGKFTCGGSLLSDRYVISAAHCFEDTQPKDVLIVAGATKLSEKGIKRNVEKISTPKEFNPMSMHMDVAIIKLTQPISGENIQAIELYKGELTPGLMIQVSGWGRTSETSNISSRMHTIRVPVIDKAFCTEEYANYATLTDTMFCAAEPEEKDSCSGDSGGPAVCDRQLCGIVSFGNGCARRGYPGVYTSIAAVKAFIENSMK